MRSFIDVNSNLYYCSYGFRESLGIKQLRFYLGNYPSIPQKLLEAYLDNV